MPQKCGRLHRGHKDKYESLPRASTHCTRATTSAIYDKPFPTPESAESAFHVPFGNLITTTAAQSSTPASPDLSEYVGRRSVRYRVALHTVQDSSTRNVRDRRELKLDPSQQFQAHHVYSHIIDTDDAYKWCNQDVEQAKAICPKTQGELRLLCCRQSAMHERTSFLSALSDQGQRLPIQPFAESWTQDNAQHHCDLVSSTSSTFVDYPHGLPIPSYTSPEMTEHLYNEQDPTMWNQVAFIPSENCAAKADWYGLADSLAHSTLAPSSQSYEAPAHILTPASPSSSSSDESSALESIEFPPSANLQHHHQNLLWDDSVEDSNESALPVPQDIPTFGPSYQEAFLFAETEAVREELRLVANYVATLEERVDRGVRCAGLQQKAAMEAKALCGDFGSHAVMATELQEAGNLADVTITARREIVTDTKRRHGVCTNVNFFFFLLHPQMTGRQERVGLGHIAGDQLPVDVVGALIKRAEVTPNQRLVGREPTLRTSMLSKKLDDEPGTARHDPGASARRRKSEPYEF
ncbi:hypothetical protein CERZMDRAFT_80351 [Cercospora zeae-maydis SCOH1-5]|uniref:Uncharacterized protein n=1 Tax=Cercospora zeae-maydis SCOH1-5 TaxID=717836 RepID=A0A6A6FW77_9PEZI|nr:hypothetical protein CERZMDRAFT_80351 [Cercospora zeae-maydis SCOH1-5]